MDYTHIALGIISFLASGWVALICWGLSKQVEALNQKVETVRQEFHAQLAEAGNEFYRRVNGNYLRKDIFTELSARVDRIEDKVDAR